ncbi:MAG TPA: hypothetical protein VFT91_02050, partial [Dehalococcoidia bacterium]|nr:hypothetical protein [Dehalococcoidia bacterium]
RLGLSPSLAALSTGARAASAWAAAGAGALARRRRPAGAACCDAAGGAMATGVTASTAAASRPWRWRRPPRLPRRRFGFVSSSAVGAGGSGSG